MTEQHSSPAAVDDTADDPAGTGMNSITTEIYEAAFSTTGEHPQCGIAIARTLHDARQRLADMLIYCDPTSTVIADIVAFHRDETVDHYEGTTRDIFAQVNIGAPGRTVTTQPLTNSTSSSTGADVVAVDGDR